MSHHPKLQYWCGRIAFYAHRTRYKDRTDAFLMREKTPEMGLYLVGTVFTTSTQRLCTSRNGLSPVFNSCQLVYLHLVPRPPRVLLEAVWVHLSWLSVQTDRRPASQRFFSNRPTARTAVSEFVGWLTDTTARHQYFSRWTRTALLVDLKHGWPSESARSTAARTAEQELLTSH